MVVTFHKDVIFNDELEENEKFSWDEFGKTFQTFVFQVTIYSNF